MGRRDYFSPACLRIVCSRPFFKIPGVIRNDNCFIGLDVFQFYMRPILTDNFKPVFLSAVLNYLLRHWHPVDLPYFITSTAQYIVRKIMYMRNRSKKGSMPGASFFDAEKRGNMEEIEAGDQ